MKMAGRFAVLALAVSSVAAMTVLEADNMALDLKERPVTKVVRLLEDSKKEIEKEMEDEAEVYEEMGCWCKSNVKDTTAAISGGRARISQLETSIEGDSARIKELTEKIKSTEAELAANQESLEKATAMRAKENKQFTGEEADYVASIDSTADAINALSKHQSSLAQLNSAAQHLLPHTRMINRASGISKSQGDLLRSFIQTATGSVAGASSFLAKPGSYAPQSGQIFGIINTMKEDFENNLDETRATEAGRSSDFSELKSIQEGAIEKQGRTIVASHASLAETEEALALAQKDLKNTKYQLQNDITFLQHVKEECATMDEDYEKRRVDRLTEIGAMDDTIGILNSDESHAAFSKMKAASFLQTKALSSQKDRRQRLISLLQHAAVFSESPKVALLAVSAQLDSFTKLKEMIDRMVGEMKTQQKDEVAQRDWCIDSFAENERSTAAADDKKRDLQVKIDGYKQKIKTLGGDIDAANAARTKMSKEMEKATEDRKEESAEFQTTMSDHHVMASILAEALDRMKQVYDFSLVQDKQQDETSNDLANTQPKFGKKLEQNDGGYKVLALLEGIIKDVKKTMFDADVSEHDAQTTYDHFMEDGKRAVKTLSEKISNLSGAKSKAKEELTLAKTDLGQTMTEIEGLFATNADLHKSCDFLTKNFEARQKARGAEMDSMNEAKLILSGA